MLAMLAAVLCVRHTAVGATDNDAITSACLERPTQACIIDAGTKMTQMLMEHPDPWATVFTRRILDGAVHARLMTGDWEGAYAAAESMRDLKEPGIYESAMSSIAHAEARTGDLAKALRMVNSIGDESRGTLLIAIADRQAISGNNAEARLTLASGLDAIRATRSEPGRVFAMTSAATVMDHVGDRSAAQEMLRQAGDVADRLSEEVFRSVSLGAVASTHANMGDIDVALSVARSIPRNSFRASALVHIVKASIKQQKSIEADNLIAEALVLARNDDFPPSRANSLGTIAALQSFLGDRTAAEDLMEEALGVAQHAKDRLGRASALNAVAVNFARCGDAKRAVETASKIDIAAERAVAYFDIAIAISNRD